MRTVTEGDVVFQPRPYQAELLQALDSFGPKLVIKSRQTGISTLCMVKAAQLICERPGFPVLVISRNQKAAKHLMSMCKVAFGSAERTDKPRVTVDNQLEFELATGARVIVEPASQETGRTFTAGWLVYDEFAFLPWQAEMWRSAQPTIEATGNVAVVTTPNGEGDLTDQWWRQNADPAKAGLSGEVSRSDSFWRCFRYPWQVVQSRDELWRQHQLAELTGRDFSQEHECCFLATGEAVFAPADIQKCVDLAGIFPEPRSAGRVIVGVDVAGMGRDESAITVLECTTQPLQILEQVAWETIKADDLQREIVARHEKYNAQVYIDFTGIGYGLAETMGAGSWLKRVTFTSGAQAAGEGDYYRVPRDVLLSTGVQAIERHELAIPEKYPELIRSLRTARQQKRQGEFVDRLDSLLLALWGAKQGGGGKGRAWSF